VFEGVETIADLIEVGEVVVGDDFATDNEKAIPIC
jgi:hypothetical protein